MITEKNNSLIVMKRVLKGDASLCNAFKDSIDAQIEVYKKTLLSSDCIYTSSRCKGAILALEELKKRMVGDGITK